MSQDPESRFSRDLKRWARRPPSLTPWQAAARIEDRLPKRPGRGVAWGLRLAAAAAMVGAMGLWWLARMPKPPASGSRSAAAVVGSVETPPLSGDVAVFYLDADTPLYLTLAPPQTKKEPTI